jgi:hypothetical protein
VPTGRRRCGRGSRRLQIADRVADRAADDVGYVDRGGPLETTSWTDGVLRRLAVLGVWLMTSPAATCRRTSRRRPCRAARVLEGVLGVVEALAGDVGHVDRLATLADDQRDGASRLSAVPAAGRSRSTGPARPSSL